MNSAVLFGYWKQVRQGLVEALDMLTNAQLDFVPRQGLWSLRETVCHIAGTEEGWLRYYTTNRWHEDLFKAEDFPSVASLKALLDKVHAETEAQFGPDPDSLMEKTAQLPWGAQTTMGWAIWHVLEHEIHHRGEVYLMLGLQGMEAPDV